MPELLGERRVSDSAVISQEEKESPSDKAASAGVEGHLNSGIYYRHWRAKTPVRAVILLAHGLGEHAGRYQAFADYFSDHGISIVAPDHLGHGASPGDRTHVVSFNDYLQPLGELRDLIGQWYEGLPCFLIGHSMGVSLRRAICSIIKTSLPAPHCLARHYKQQTPPLRSPCFWRGYLPGGCQKWACYSLMPPR